MGNDDKDKGKQKGKDTGEKPNDGGLRIEYIQESRTNKKPPKD